MLRRLVPAALALALTAWGAIAATPPGRPRAGLPGGAENPDAEVVKRSVGTASAATFVFHLPGEPAAPRPVVVLLHGWGALNPMIYGAWIDHLARRGYLVLFPAFQEVGKTRPGDASTIATGLLRDALNTLGTDPVARPDLSRLAYIGHSAGAGIAANLAAGAKASGLPVPKLVYVVMPGGIASDAASRGIALSGLSQVDPSVSLIAMIGDREFAASDRAARRILREATEVPPSRKLFMRSLSDDHGFPSLSATLASPGASKDGYERATIKVQPDPPVDRKAARPAGPRWSADMVLSGEQQVLLGQLARNGTDTLDYLAFWKTFDMAAEAAFAGRDMESLRTTAAFLDMGKWSDGWPVKRLYAETPKAGDATASPAPVRAGPAVAPSKMPVTRTGRARPTER